jgi:hypothetical protein
MHAHTAEIMTEAHSKIRARVSGQRLAGRIQHGVHEGWHRVIGMCRHTGEIMGKARSCHRVRDRAGRCIVRA